MSLRKLCTWIIVALSSSLLAAEPKEFRDFSVDGVKLKQSAKTVVPYLKARKYKPVKNLEVIVWESPRKTGFVQIQWDEVTSISGTSLEVGGYPFAPKEASRASLKTALEKWGFCCYPVLAGHVEWVEGIKSIGPEGRGLGIRLQLESHHISEVSIYLVDTFTTKREIKKIKNGRK